MQSQYLGDKIFHTLDSYLDQSPKVFLVRGWKSFEGCGAESVLYLIFERHGNAITEYYDFCVNPKAEDVERGCKLLEESDADLIIGVGGGSVIDMAKLIRHKHQALKGRRIPLIAMPTTAGSGAEATHFAVVYEHGEKKSVSAPDITPDCALIYPPFTYSADRYLTACAGFDAIAHAIESYWSVKSTDESRRLSAKALSTLWRQLPQLVNNPNDKKLRESVASGAYYAGKAIDLTTTTAPHAFAYKFTSNHDMPHAHAVAMTFPYFWAVNCRGKSLNPELSAREYSERIKSLKELLGCDADTDGEMMHFFISYLSEIGLVKRQFTETEFKAVIDGFNRQRAGNNPVMIDDTIQDGLLSYLLS